MFSLDSNYKFFSIKKTDMQEHIGIIYVHECKSRTQSDTSRTYICNKDLVICCVSFSIIIKRLLTVSQVKIDRWSITLFLSQVKRKLFKKI